MALMSFHLFSDEIFRMSGIQHYLDAAAEIQGFIKNLQLYGADHAVVSGETAPMEALNQVFSQEHCLYVLRLADDIYVQGILVDETEPRVHEVGDAMKRHELRKLQIWRGARAGELAVLAGLLSTKPGEVARAGGFAACLEARGVRYIEVREASEAQEAAGTKRPGGGWRTAWQLGLEKIGFDAEEFFDYMRFRPTHDKLMTREMRLAVPMLSNPRVVAELVLDMAQLPNDPENVDSGQTVMALRRVESVLLMHSGLTADEITEVLRDATKLFDDDLRLQLLSDYLHDAASGRPWMNLEIFEFSMAERFRVLQQRVNDREALDELQFLMTTPEMRDEFMDLYHRLLEDEGHGRDVIESADQAVRDLLAKQEEERQGFVLNEPISPDVHVATAARFARLRQDLEVGYLFALADLLVDAESHERAVSLRGRLQSLIDSFFEAENSAVLFDAFTHLRVLTDRQPRWLVPEYWQQLTNLQVDHILWTAREVCRRDIPRASAFLSGIEPYLPEYAGTTMLHQALNDEDARVRRTMTNVLVYSDRDVMDEIIRHLESNVLARRMNALDMLVVFQTEQANSLIARGLEDSDKLIRLGSVRMIASTNSRESFQQLLEMVNGEGPGKDRPVRLAAIQAVGQLRDDRAVPALEAIISQRMTFSNETDMDLRAAAAYALRTIASDEAIAAIDRHWSELKFTRLDVLDHRSNSAVSQFGSSLLRKIFRAGEEEEWVDDIESRKAATMARIRQNVADGQRDGSGARLTGTPDETELAPDHQPEAGERLMHKHKAPAVTPTAADSDSPQDASNLPPTDPDAMAEADADQDQPGSGLPPPTPMLGAQPDPDEEPEPEPKREVEDPNYTIISDILEERE